MRPQECKIISLTFELFIAFLHYGKSVLNETQFAVNDQNAFCFCLGAHIFTADKKTLQVASFIVL